jgi:hypothetical protein
MTIVISLNEVSRAHVARCGCGCFSASDWRVCARCAEGFSGAGDGARRDDTRDGAAAQSGAAAAE